SLFVAPRTISISDLGRFVRGYHEGWTAAGHAGRGDIGLSIPLYVAPTERQAREEPEASTMHFFRAISEALKKSDGASVQTDEARSARAGRLAELTYGDVLREQAVFGTPEAVVARLLELRGALGFSSLSAWMNPGGSDPPRARADVDAPLCRARRAAAHVSSDQRWGGRCRSPQA